MSKLNAALVNARPELIGGRDFCLELTRPERVLQFGEGGFLRAFVEPMIDDLNARGVFDGRVVVVQPIVQGLVDVLNAQDGLYTLLLRGVKNGELINERSVVCSISRGIDPYVDFDAFLACARNPELRFIVSNTTEAGIAFRAEDRFDDAPPASFPGKLTRFLYERFLVSPNGFVLLPCELIDRNGDNLKRTVLQTAAQWELPSEFLQWIERENTFTNTLVDRIVTGYPKGEDIDLGYEDALLDTGEPFQFWVIEGPAELAKEFPVPATWTDNLKPYRDRKVHILNGAHTSMTMMALLAGKETVGECMQDADVRAWVEAAINEEIIPTLTLPADELRQFASAVLERFSNPFIRHQLMSIALNSVSKYKARVLPTVERYIDLFQRPPEKLSYAMAALIEVYSSGKFPIKDDPTILAAFAGKPSVSEVLARIDWWGRDLRQLPGFEAAVSRLLPR
ncbi:MAG: tagaturonate reductase [Bryobacteraceae bacterium]|nr:tagaturonate reductase [Bryobacteraceae bacterium]